MVTLTIDGRDGRRSTTGTTILDAARAARASASPRSATSTGIAPSASCFLCAVQIEGTADAVAVVRHAGGRGHGGPHRHATRCARRARWRSSCCCPTTSATASAPAAPAARRGSTSPASSRTSPDGDDRPGRRRSSPTPDAARLARAASARGCASSAAAAATPASRSRSAPPPLRRRRAISRPRRRYVPRRAPATGKRVAIVGAGPGRARRPRTTCCARGHDVTVLRRPRRARRHAALRHPGVPAAAGRCSTRRSTSSRHSAASSA